MEQNDHTLSSMRDLTGKKVGTCLLERMIGQGGMGEVYLAHQERPERRVAVKTLRAHLAIDVETIQQFRVRFQREANLIARLDHINIVPIYEYGEQEGIGYLVMPYLTGGSLRDLLQRQGALSPVQALTYLEQAANALDYAHEQGIIHRDLKPANFLLHADGRLVLADFGIARIQARDDQSSTGVTLTGPGMLLGTPEYMAPEMVRGESLDKRADIYEMGIVLYQMLSGSVPFKGNTPLLVAAMQLQQPLPSLHASNPAIPPAVDSALQVATAKVVAERFPTAGALAQAFREAVLPSDRSPSLTSMNAPTLLAQRNLPPTILAHTYEVPPPTTTAGGASVFPSTQLSPGASYPQASPGSSSSATYPQTPYPPLKRSPGHNRRQPWFVLLGIAIIAILVIGGILIGLQLNHSNSNIVSQQVSPAVTQTTNNITPVTTNTPPLPSPTSTLIQGVPKGSALYTTNAPGASSTNASCDGGNEQWADYNSPAITCQAGNVILHNPQQALAGVILLTLPENASYPSNYVVEAQIQEETASQADFGLYFRNQAGNAQGIYTFLIHADGSWASYVYDNNTGSPTQIGTGSAGFYAHAQLTLDVVASGSRYTFYVNGQQVGRADDTTYQSGTAGVVVDAGGTIDISAFALYALS
ncbi:MAG TPA: protein kinase [Ktedonobacteraceae bacterium]|jgi:serine/threonine protein kinase